MSARREYAVQFVAKERAELREVPVPPESLASDEVAGRTLASAVSVGTELAVFQEQGKYYGTPKYPLGSGYAAVFEIERVGTGVKDRKVGDRVFCMGPHRSFQRTKARDTVIVPADVPDHVAPFARLIGISMSTLTTTAARPPARVIVTGLGIVGHLAARVFDLCQYRVTAVDPVESRRRLAGQAGLADVRAAVPLDDPALAGKVDLVVECSGHEQAALDGCLVLRRRGEVVLLGVPWVAKSNLLAHEVLFQVFYRYAVLRSGWEWEVPGHETDFMRGSMYANFAAALDWLAKGRIRVDRLYEVVPPADASRVYESLLRGRWPTLTAVFDWTRLG